VATKKPSKKGVKIQTPMGTKTLKGRTPKVLDPRVRELFLQGIRQNLTRNLSCKLSGIDPATLSRWLTNAREAEEQGDHDNIYVIFRNKIEAVEAETASELLQTIEEASHKDWRAASWIAERRHPDDYGKRESLTLEGDEDRPLQVTNSLSDAQLDGAVDKILALRKIRSKNGDNDE